MKEQKSAELEELEIKNREMNEEKLNQVSGGGIVIGPTENRQPKKPDDDNLF